MCLLSAIARCWRQVPLPFELHLVILLRVGARRLAAHLHGGIGRFLAIANLAGHRAVFVARLQQAHNLIARHAHVGIVIHRVRVDLGPAMVRVLRLLPRETVRYMVTMPESS